jgi:hypothetical protein
LAKEIDVTILYDIDNGKELLRIPGLVALPIGAVVQLGKFGDSDNLCVPRIPSMALTSRFARPALGP